MKPFGYAAVQKATVSGRDMERELLERITSKLKSARIDDPSGTAKLHEALRLNRKIWLTFASDLASDKNPLPDEIKASIISIAAFVERNTFAATKSQTVIDCFVDINNAIMVGLTSPQESSV
ncbi:MAG: flagellar biosynthesis regulator FlaF [Pseudomonadota bacterium]